MLLEFIIALLLGLLAGTFTGLFPGIHINLISAILISAIPALLFLQNIPVIYLSIFIISMAITHTFLDFIPSIYLGAPDEDNFLSILPGHQLLKQGKGHEAVSLTLLGSLTALPIILIFIPIFIYLLPLIFSTSKAFLPYLLIFISFYLIFKEKEPLQALTIFLLAGFLGFATLNLPVKQPMLPLLTGLFGTSTLIISLRNKLSLPKQTISKIKQTALPKKDFLKSSLSAIISAPLCSFLPGIGSGHAALIGSEIIPQNNKTFLFLVGSINTIVTALSFITLYSLQKTRTGAAATIKSLLTIITPQNLIIIILTIFISGFLAFFIGIKISKLAALSINKVNYKTLSITIISILILLTFFLSNPLGLIVLITSTSLGIFTILSKSRRINLMGVLIIPTIIFYLLV